MKNYVISHGLLGGRELDMVRPSGGRVDQPASDPPDQQRVINLELNCLIQLDTSSHMGQHVIELLGLGHGPGEAVKNEAAGTISPRQVVLDEIHHELVRHKLPGIHQRLGLLANISASGHGGTQHVTGGKVAHTKGGHKLGGLGALALKKEDEEDEERIEKKRRR